MKKFFSIFTLSSLFYGMYAVAQVVAPVVAPVAPAPAPAPVAGSWLVALAQSHPWILSVLVIVGGLRLVLKPLFAGLHTFFQSSGLVSWDQKELAIEQSAPMKVVFFVLDYLGSIKMPVKEQPAVAAAVSATSDTAPSA